VVIEKNHTGYETTSEERAISEFYVRYSVKQMNLMTYAFARESEICKMIWIN
jgi:hypothetical protein